MSSPHVIRLRGGWTLSTDSGAQPWTLPCTARSLAGQGLSVTLIRKFNHPPVQSDGQVCRLTLRRIVGVTAVIMDGARFEPVMPLIDHPESGFDFEIGPAPSHRLEMIVDTSAMSDTDDWGQIGIEIEENASPD